MNNELLVKSIRELCKKNNIAVSQLESKLNFGSGLISRWVKNSPSLDRIVDIADYFHVTLDEVVGYKQEDIFLDILHDLTSSKKIKWFIIDMSTAEKVANPHMDFQFECYDEDKYTEKSYFTKYNDGFIIIYAFYEYGKLINPDELSLYIQPSEDRSEYAWQDYSAKELRPLWLNILSNADDAPVEIKAEEFKNAFILNRTKTNSNSLISGNISDRLDTEAIKKITENPAVQHLMELSKSPEFQKMQQVMSNPEFQAALEAASKLHKQLDWSEK